jgi:hypothetical protein
LAAKPHRPSNRKRIGPARVPLPATSRHLPGTSSGWSTCRRGRCREQDYSLGDNRPYGARNIPVAAASPDEGSM